MQSYCKSILSQWYRQNELKKKKAYDTRFKEIEYGSFSPMVFSTWGGMSTVATIVYKEDRINHCRWTWQATQQEDTLDSLLIELFSATICSHASMYLVQLLIAQLILRSPTPRTLLALRTGSQEQNKPRHQHLLKPTPFVYCGLLVTMTYELTIALKWLWICLKKGCCNPVLNKWQCYSPGNRRIHALGNPQNWHWHWQTPWNWQTPWHWCAL